MRGKFYATLDDLTKFNESPQADNIAEIDDDMKFDEHIKKQKKYIDSLSPSQKEKYLTKLFE